MKMDGNELDIAPRGRYTIFPAMKTIPF